MTSLQSLRRVCSFVGLVVLVLISLAAQVTADLSFTGVTLVDDSTNNLGSGKFILAWDSAANTTSTTMFTNVLTFKFEGASTDPVLFTAASADFSSSDCTATVNIDGTSRDMSLSFVCSLGIFPQTANNVTLTMTRSTATIACDSYAPYKLSSVGSGAITPSDVSAAYFWNLCPVSFTDVKLTSGLTNGLLVVTLSWAGATESAHQTFNPKLIIKNIAGVEVFTSASATPVAIAGSTVTVSTDRIGGVSGDTLVLTFAIPAGASLPPAGSVVLPVTTIGMCPTAYSGTYQVSAYPADRVTVAGALTGIVQLPACPRLDGVVLASTTTATGVNVTVSWTNFTNSDNVAVASLSPLQLAPWSWSNAEVLDGIGAGYAEVSVATDIKIAVNYTLNAYTLKFVAENGATIPSSGTFMFVANLNTEIACDSTSTYSISPFNGSFLTMTGTFGVVVVSAVTATACPINRFSLATLTANADDSNAGAGSATLRVTWYRFAENFGLTAAGADVLAIKPILNKGFFSDVDGVVTVFNGSGAVATGVTATAKFDAASGVITVAIAKAPSATFPSSGYLVVKPTRATGQVAMDIGCEATAIYTVAGANADNTVAASYTDSLLADYKWTWCSVAVGGAAIAFSIEDGTPRVSLAWDALAASSGNPRLPKLRVVMTNGLFRATEQVIFINDVYTLPALFKVETDGGPIIVTFNQTAGSVLPVSGSLVMTLDYLENIVCDIDANRTSITLESADSAASVITNTADPSKLTGTARTPACPTLNGFSVTQTNNGVTMSWTGFDNPDSLTLKTSMVSLEMVPVSAGVTVFKSVVSDVIPIEKSTHYAFLSVNNGNFSISFFQAGNDAFPQIGFVELKLELVDQCGIENIAYQVRPAAAKGIGMSAVGNFVARTLPCIHAFSGVRLTAPFADDSVNKTAILTGSTGFRFAWSDYKSDATSFSEVVKISIVDDTFSGPSLLIDATSAPAALRDAATGEPVVGWTVQASVASSVVALSFVQTGTAAFPTAAYVDVQPPRAQDAHTCQDVELYSVANLDGVSTFAAADGNSELLSTLYVWAVCPVKFDTMRLTPMVDNGVVKLAVDWNDVAVDSYNTIAPALKISRENGTAVYAEAWGPETVAVNANVSVTVQSVGGEIALEFTLYNGATVPKTGSFRFPPAVSASAHSCVESLTGVYKISSGNEALATVNNKNDADLVFAEARALSCPSFTGMSLTLLGNTMTVAWTGYINYDDVPTGNFSTYSISLDAESVPVLTNVTDATSTIDLGDGVTVNVWFVDNDFHFSFSAVDLETIANAGSFSFDVDKIAECGLTSQYTLGVDDATASGFSGTALTVTAVSATCPDPAVFSGVSLASETLASTFKFVATWTGFTNAQGASLALTFRIALTTGASDIFNTASTNSVVLIDVDSNIGDLGIATVTLANDAYIVALAPTAGTPVPANGRLTVSLTLRSAAACGTTSTFALESASAKAVTLVSEGATSVSYSTPSCMPTFTGLSLAGDTATLSGNKGLVIAWTDFSNKDAKSLANAFVITRINAFYANPFTGVPTTAQPVKDAAGADVTGVTASLSYSSVSGDITVSFALAAGVVFPTQGSLAVTPTVDATLACDQTTYLRLDINSTVVRSSAPKVITFGFKSSVCTYMQDFNVTQVSQSGAQLTLAVTYEYFQQGLKEGVITLESFDHTDLYTDLPAMDIIVTADDFAQITVTGSVANGVITLPLTDKLPRAGGRLQFTLQLAVTADCDLTTTLMPSLQGEVFASLVTPGLACTYDWRCTGASAGAASDGLVCSTTDASQFSTVCSNNCGNGTLSLVESYCSRLNNGTYMDKATGASKCVGAKPALTLSCTDYTCPSALWRCSAIGGNVWVDCANDGAFGTCENYSGCHFNAALKRTAMCVATSTSTTDLGSNCPTAVVAKKPALIKDCVSNLDTCSMRFDSEDECYDADKKLAICGAATRNGTCINNATNSDVALDLCVEAQVPLTQACANIPADCSKPAGWVGHPASNCETASAPLCKSVRKQTVECAFVSAKNVTVTAAEYVCDNVPKVLPLFVNCDTPAVTCAANHGSCSGFLPYENDKQALATCVCHPGFFDSACNTAVTITNVVATWNKTSRAINVDWASNAADVAGLKVTVIVTPSGYTTGINVGQVTLGALSAEVSAATYKLAPGAYNVTVFLTSLSTATATVTVGSLCDNGAGQTHSCDNDGTCDEATGVCTCKGAWSGAYCTVSPCQSAVCNTANTQETSCSVVDHQAHCNCLTAEDGKTSLFKDALCNEAVDSTCPADLKCSNSGVPLSVYNKETHALECANTCSCPQGSPFGGALCDTCNNVCSTEGTVGAISAQCMCKCKPGYTDESCGCRYANLRLVFPLSALSFLGTATEFAQLLLWISALKSDLKAVGGKTSLVYSVSDLTRITVKRGSFVNVLVSAGPDCSPETQKAAALPVAFAKHSARMRPMSAARFTAQGSSVDMTETYAALKTITTALSAGQSSGSTSTTLGAALPDNVGISDDACGLSCVGLPASTGPGKVETDTDDGGSAGGSGSNDDDIIIGVVVGVGGFLIIAAIVFFAFYKKLFCFAGSSAVTDAEKNTGIEMTAAGAGYDV